MKRHISFSVSDARGGFRARWWLLIAVAVGVVAAVLVWRLMQPERIDVTVNGRRVTVGSPFTVAHALRQAHLGWPRDGVLRAAMTGRVLDPHWHRSLVEVGRRRVERRDHYRLRDGASVSARRGSDEVEATLQRRVPVPAPGLPPVEHELWAPGTSGLADQIVGDRSGEVVNQSIVQAPVTASRVPGKVIALSFDDGPNPRYTPQVLQILARAGIKATFCVIGHEARLHPELIQAIRDQGHELCDHTETHPFLDQVPGDQLGSQISGPVEYCRVVTGQTLRFLRPPYGAINQAVIDTAHNQGLRVLEWSVDPRDFTRPPALVIVQRVVTRAHPGGVVLMHDGGGDRSNTVAALPVIISQLQAQGYSFAQPVA